jgi:phenylacetate-CoA ligase
MSRLAGRTDDMISVRGVHFYPAQIAAILASLEGAAPRFVLALRREGGQDCVEVRVEVSGTNFFDEMRRQSHLVEAASRRIREEIGIPAHVRLVEPRSLGGEGAAAVRVVDER